MQKNYSQVWSHPITSGLETERAYSGTNQLSKQTIV